MKDTTNPLKGLILGALVMSLALAGCASVPNVDASKSALQQVKSVTVIAVREPGAIQVVNIGGAAMAFGAVGGLIQANTNLDHSKTFQQELVQNKVSFAKPMEAAIEEALRADGFQVSVDRKQWPVKAADGKSDDYSGIHVDTDAILLVWFGMDGYMSPPNSSHYLPWVVVKARLLDAKTKGDLYFKTFCVGYQMKIENAVLMSADEKYRFGSFDSLMGGFDQAVAGLIDSGNLAAHRIGWDLAKAN
jgi:hypothetical protein